MRQRCATPREQDGIDVAYRKRQHLRFGAHPAPEVLLGLHPVTWSSSIALLGNRLACSDRRGLRFGPILAS